MFDIWARRNTNATKNPTFPICTKIRTPPTTKQKGSCDSTARPFTMLLLSLEKRHEAHPLPLHQVNRRIGQIIQYRIGFFLGIGDGVYVELDLGFGAGWSYANPRTGFELIV